MYIAHISEINGQKKEQSVITHCRNTAEYAGNLLKEVGLLNCGRFCGLVHDMGKLTAKFKNYIERAFNGENVVRGEVNHTFASVIFILENYHTDKNSKMDKLTAEILA